MGLRRLLGRREQAERALRILGNNIIMLEERPMPLHAFSLLRTAPTSSPRKQPGYSSLSAGLPYGRLAGARLQTPKKREHIWSMWKTGT